MVGRIRGMDVVIFSVICAIGVYTGTRFFEPIVIDQLKKDGGLRTDVEIPKYDEDGNPVLPKSMLQIREELDQVLAEQKLAREQAKKKDQE
ncbi:Ecm19 [Kluyveromyces lactis]|uniref:KLLA0E05083p n=1 Tax=Kluyveromyces lactis (strain ATCC 8585 / CBS 2359 / DSM 70799 / NBRC 1267 / NRRL Y-1140 / WM37) TaxID=284590 RepID=Q6CPG5_KLULA|nr:uncharacterized protein KLLA0_E05083g [Kluyveromyces lactis]QEU62898.1 Ecm19 [Kluyveromyces lactis]CAG99261.1 KLLA0E05083p [Kluyveromyces lactis]|eukprot:XP_454174.1 uncharacterized protein KLLA0_E05083g [Kluyveromyces lactis]